MRAPENRDHARWALWVLGSLPAAAAGALAVAGCPGELEHPERFPIHTATSTDCPDVERELFPTSCGLSGCHNATDRAGALDLVSPNLEARVAGRPGSSGCGQTLLADPSAPADSLIYIKLQADPPCGAQMPRESSPLSEAHMACVSQWIAGLEVAAGGSGTGGGTAGTGGGGGAGGSAGSGGATGGAGGG